MGQTILDVYWKKFFAEKAVYLKIRKDPFMFGIFYDWIKKTDPALWRVIYSNMYSLQQALTNKDFDTTYDVTPSILRNMEFMDALNTGDDGIRPRIADQLYADNGDILYLTNCAGRTIYWMHRSCFTGQDPFLRCAAMYNDCIEMPLLLMHLLQTQICRTGGLSVAERQKMFLENTARIFMKDEVTVEKLITTELSVPARRDLIRAAVLRDAGPEEAARLIQTADMFNLHSMPPARRYRFYAEVVKRIFPDIDFGDDGIISDGDDSEDTAGGRSYPSVPDILVDQHTIDILNSRKGLLDRQYQKLSEKCNALSRQLDSISGEKDQVSAEISELDCLIKSISDMKTDIDYNIKSYFLKYNVTE